MKSISILNLKDGSLNRLINISKYVLFTTKGIVVWLLRAQALELDKIQ